MTDVELPCRNTVDKSLLLSLLLLLLLLFLLLLLLLLLKKNRNDFLKNVHSKYRQGKLL